MNPSDSELNLQAPTGDSPSNRGARTGRGQPRTAGKDTDGTSSSQIAANRRNAKKSTGPKSTVGKEIVSQNAVTHGMLSRSSLIREGEGQEDVAAFDALHARLREELKPQSVLDELDIARIAISVTRLERVQRRELGMRRQDLDGTSSRRDSRQRAAVHRAITAVEYVPPGDESAPAVPLDEADWSVLFESSMGLGYVLKFLSVLQQDLTNGFGLGANSLRQLEMLFGRARGGLHDWCAGYAERLASHADDTELRSYSRKLDRVLGEEIERVAAKIPEIQEIEKRSSQIEPALHALPDGPAYDTLLRYEAGFLRDIRQAEASLTRRRAARSTLTGIGGPGGTV
jgi:hypothetical protein